MTHLLDVNVLLALTWQEHEHHARARRWFRGKTWATCPLTELSFLRLSSSPLGDVELTVPEAREVLQELINRPEHVFWPDDLPALAGPVIARGPRALPDAYLASLAQHHRGRLATFDSGITELPGIDARSLEVI